MLFCLFFPREMLTPFFWLSFFLFNRCQSFVFSFPNWRCCQRLQERLNHGKFDVASSWKVLSLWRCGPLEGFNKLFLFFSQWNSCLSHNLWMMELTYSLVQELEVFLQDVDTFTVRVPEFNLLRQYHSDALSLICRFHELLVNIQERKDYSKVVNELTCILKDGELLRVQGLITWR